MENMGNKKEKILVNLDMNIINLKKKKFLVKLFLYIYFFYLMNFKRKNK